jgi:adenine-specific DNA-methyltransferase
MASSKPFATFKRQMKKEFFAYIKKNFGAETSSVNHLLVSSFIYFNNLEVFNNNFIKEFIINKKDSEYEKFLQLIEYIKSKKIKFDFESLVEYFEFVISPEDKVINGAVYTPKYIRDYIVEESFKKSHAIINECLIGDFACGCGCFLYSSAKKIKEITSKTYFQIFKENIYGLDITEYSIERTKIVLSLLALTEGEDEDFEYNIFKGNALSFDWKKACLTVQENGGFDFILSNPPYVSAKNISEDNRELLNKWSVSQIGNPDLYIPFFQIGYENLCEGGIVSYITVNSFIRSLNGRFLRKYLQDKQPQIEIIDFGDEQIFHGRSTYTCLCFISNASSEEIGYINTKSKNLVKEINLSYTKYKDLDANEGWKLGSKETMSIIKRIENAGKSLGETVDIRNGFATLRNSIYLFKPIEQTKEYYIFERDGKYYEIEKGICRDAIKANILRSENDIEKFKEKIIFPYETIQYTQVNLFDEYKPSISILKEDVLIKNYPKAYQYLLENKKLLANRDKGKKEYGAWYAYGRNQALAINGYKLLFPCYTNKPYFILTEEKDLLFYNGYALVSNNIQELEVLKKILNSSLFWFYIQKTSKPYSNDYFALSKNFIKSFGIYNLSKFEKEILLGLIDEYDIDLFLSEKYKVNLSKIKKGYELNHNKQLL